VDRGVNVVEVDHQLPELVLGVLNLASDLSALDDEAGKDVRVRHWLLPSRFLSRQACCVRPGSRVQRGAF
jgi:hypothetical protein